MSWTPVNDGQAGSWAPVLPDRIVIDAVDTPGGSAIGTVAIGGGLAFSYIPNSVLWLPEQNDNTPGWTSVTT